MKVLVCFGGVSGVGAAGFRPEAEKGDGNVRSHTFFHCGWARGSHETHAASAVGAAHAAPTALFRCHTPSSQGAVEPRGEIEKEVVGIEAGMRGAKGIEKVFLPRLTDGKTPVAQQFT